MSTSSKDTPSAADYLIGHRKSGLKVGDTVRVGRVAEDFEAGWQDAWSEPSMTRTVGQNYVIDRDDGDGGFYVGGYYRFPHFVLHKVKAGTRCPRVVKPIEVVLNSDYTAEITPTHVKVGCQMIPHKAVLKVVAAIRRIKARKPTRKARS